MTPKPSSRKPAVTTDAVSLATRLAASGRIATKLTEIPSPNRIRNKSGIRTSVNGGANANTGATRSPTSITETTHPVSESYDTGA